MLQGEGTAVQMSGVQKGVEGVIQSVLLCRKIPLAAVRRPLRPSGETTEFRTRRPSRRDC